MPKPYQGLPDPITGSRPRHGHNLSYDGARAPLAMAGAGTMTITNTHPLFDTRVRRGYGQGPTKGLIS